jgi:hypothetical protein
MLAPSIKVEKKKMTVQKALQIDFICSSLCYQYTTGRTGLHDSAWLTRPKLLNHNGMNPTLKHDINDDVTHLGELCLTDNQDRHPSLPIDDWCQGRTWRPHQGANPTTLREPVKLINSTLEVGADIVPITLGNCSFVMESQEDLVKTP